jgi:hypothetical protein
MIYVSDYLNSWTLTNQERREGGKKGVRTGFIEEPYHARGTRKEGFNRGDE